MHFQDRKVTVMGLGHFGGGLGAAKWLARQGARVTVTDLADERVLAESLAQLDTFPIEAFHLSGHREEDFRAADLVVVNPAVRPGNSFLQIAHKAGVPIRTELELFLNACPAKAIGVTGSNGKSTTAAMIAAILRGAGCQPANVRGTGFQPVNAGRTGFQPVKQSPIGDRRTANSFVVPPSDGKCGRKPAEAGTTNGLCRCPAIAEQGKNSSGKIWLGGNLGGTLLESLLEMQPDEWVVLEISSFQLWQFSPDAKMPQIAVVTSCTPNHLDWHGTFAQYAAAKQKLLVGQSATATAILNTFDAEVSPWKRFARGRLFPPYPAEKIAQIKLAAPGEHNRRNAALAAAAACAAGCTEQEIVTGLEHFHGLPQRCEFVAELDGRRYYNDSAATTPESTIAALETFNMPLWLLAGGRNKGFDFLPLAETVVRHARGAAFFGSCREELRHAVVAQDNKFPCSTFECLAQAFERCQENAKPGEAILLSPGCASTDQFQNYQRRGEAFVEMVKRRM